MLKRVPVTALLLGILALLMLVPALYGAIEGAWESGRGFLYAGLFSLFGAGALGMLLRPMGPRETARNELLVLVVAWLMLPAFAALPLVLLTPWIGWTGAWFEMVAALTTTGGSVYPRASAAPDQVQLWRGLVGWYGGLLTLTGAYVVLAPRRLGGYEVMAAAENLPDPRAVDLRVQAASFESRSHRALRTIVPVYLGLTGVLALAFNVFGQPGLVAAVHAMSILSTSGITPVDGGFHASGHTGLEAAALIFMVLAASRGVYAPATQAGRKVDWRRDPELHMLAWLVALTTAVLFLRHWVGVLTIDVDVTSADGLSALWGSVFTTLSFLTTTGFQSHAWDSAREWSGLANPGLILLGLAAIGGGAATTAGGIKLIRAYALLRHGLRELERIAAPHSIAGHGSRTRGLRREGAFIAWAFLMLFILALMLSVLALTASGLRFSDALVASVAALSNTGPAFALVAEQPQGFAVLSALQQKILAAAMILGRIETLAVIAMFNPDVWPARGAGAKNTGKI